MKADQQTSPFQRILIGVDDEGRSDAAVWVGATLAEAFHSQVELIHSVDLPDVEHDQNSPSSLKTDLAALNAQLLMGAWKTQLARLKSVLEGSVLARVPEQELLHVTSLSPQRAILERSKLFGADLILLGPHRERDSFDFGSTARSILAQASAPVWIQKESPRTIRNILVPVDLSLDSHKTLQAARTLASKFAAEVRVMHCLTPPAFTGSTLGSEASCTPLTYIYGEMRSVQKRQLQELVQEFDWQGVPHRTSYWEGDPSTQILSEAQSTDLVVMGTHGRTGLASSVLGGVAYRVLRNSQVPILAVRHPNRNWLFS